MQSMNPRLVLGATLFTTPGMKTSGHFAAAGLSLVILVALVLVVIRFALYCLGSKPNPPDDDAGDGWGRRPPEAPWDRPRDPKGGMPIPLGVAVQARVRLRGKGRLADMLPAHSRRPAREPERRPGRRRTPA